jgi:hypothetical protein
MAIGLTGVMTVLGAVKELVVAPIRGWQDRKAAKLESDLRINEAVTEAKVQRLAQGQSADIAWEKTSIDNSGWKDEFWTIVLSIPAIFCFMPGMAGYIMEGFDVLRETPDWYQWALLIAIGSSFGVRRFTDLMNVKKGV